MPASLVVVHDPFCGWCYGAKPLVRAVVDAAVLPVHFVHRALFTDGHEMANSPAMSAKIRQFDARIAAMSGVAFSEVYRTSLLDAPGLVHDSWLTALATQIVKRDAPMQEHAFLERMQEARFIEGQNLNERGVLAALLEEFGLPDDLDSPQMIEAARAEQKRGVMLCSNYGSGGVPLLLLEQDGTLQPVQHGAFLGKPGDFATALAAYVGAGQG